MWKTQNLFTIVTKHYEIWTHEFFYYITLNSILFLQLTIKLYISTFILFSSVGIFICNDNFCNLSIQLFLDIPIGNQGCEDMSGDECLYFVFPKENIPFQNGLPFYHFHERKLHPHWTNNWARLSPPPSNLLLAYFRIAFFETGSFMKSIMVVRKFYNKLSSVHPYYSSQLFLQTLLAFMLSESWPSVS